MTMTLRRILQSITLGVALALAAPTFAQDGAAPSDKEAAYAHAIEKRTQDILAALELKDASKAAGVHDAIVARYRDLRTWHDANDGALKDLNKRLSKAQEGESDPIRGEIAQAKSSLRALHDRFINRLSKDLTAQQVETVKDRMTYDVVQVTYNAYGQMLPGLTDGQRARILDLLKEAREEAMDGGSAEEKHAVFGRYKGRINNYLAGEGYDLKEASKELADKQKAGGAK
jgi:hypothetical protein